MKKYLLLFQEVKPCDLLVNDLKHIMRQTRDAKNHVSLFQHIGLESSLKGKVQKLRDRYFRDINKLPSIERLAKNHSDLSQLYKPIVRLVKGHSHLSQFDKPGDRLAKVQYDVSIFYKQLRVPNPHARIYTTMDFNGAFSPDRPYDVRKSGFFWAVSPKIGTYYRIILDSPINITVVHIKTGHPQHGTDMLQSGAVKIGSKSGNQRECYNTTTIGLFEEGVFYKTIDKHVLASCLEIIVTESQLSWMILYDIQIGYTSQNPKKIRGRKHTSHK